VAEAFKEVPEATAEEALHEEDPRDHRHGEGTSEGGKREK
jgi:hypothetical protein